jgi:hypothetical protein
VLADTPVTIDLDTTDVEVYGREKRGVAYNHQGQRVGWSHVATWAKTADLGDGTDDPRTSAPDLLRRALGCLSERAMRSGQVAMRADAGYFAGALARATHDEQVSFAIGAKRIAPLWQLLASPRTTGTTRPAWTAPRSQSLSTARTGGRRTRRCWSDRSC